MRDRQRTLLVSGGIIAVVASLAAYFAWRADAGATPPPAPAPASQPAAPANGR